MGMTAAIDEVHKALTNSTDQLGRISGRLENEYSRLHAESPSHTNPYNLLLRMRTLQNRLPELRDGLLTCHQQKIDLVNICQTQLQEAFLFAQKAQTCTSDSTEQSSSDVLSHRVMLLSQQLSSILVQFPPANDVFLRALQMKSNESNRTISLAAIPSTSSENALNIAEPIPQASTSGDLIVQKATTPSSSSEEISTIGNKPSASKATSSVKTKASSKARPLKSRSSSVSPTESHNNSNQPKFEPVSKAVYNRLPRNLKIQAGKLPDINAFYEKVFKFLVENPGGVSDEKLMRALDETSLTRFEVLRGLAVLRSTKQGWVLACLK